MMMPSLIVSAATLVSLLLISFHSYGGYAAVPLRRVCPDTNNNTYTPNSKYASNLKLVLSYLSSNATLDSGFYNSTAGEDRDRVYGSFLCRGDVTSNVCRDCVETAIQETLQGCPSRKDAVSWYDECRLRYSSRLFFSIVDEKPQYSIPNLDKVSVPDGDGFHRVLQDAVDRLANRAAFDVSSHMFATGETKFLDHGTIYSLVQCSLDLSGRDCNRCLRYVFAQLTACCSRILGAQIHVPSCSMRYEVYPFYRIEPAGPVRSPPLAPSRYPKKKKLKSLRTILAIVFSIVITAVILGVHCAVSRKKAKKLSVKDKVNDGTQDLESRKCDLDTIRRATDNFSRENEIGDGGFGRVYKGILSDGQQIAVKRLSKNSGQGTEEFKNEAAIVAKLEHRNLVKLLGYCWEGKEKILIYEFVPNKTLDYYLFDQEKQATLLDWGKRYNIILGIARGMLYLHEESRLKIIHRDLKGSNILLDGDLNPKISDFGMARIFMEDQIQGVTNRMAGTFGYMAPEYAMQGKFSAKSDVYSYGVLILEIISGKRSNSLSQSDCSEDLLSYAWRHWKKRTALELLDPNLGNCYSASEAMRCIHIGLLCIQENAKHRSSMASVVLMLDSHTVTLPSLSRPLRVESGQAHQDCE